MKHNLSSCPLVIYFLMTSLSVFSKNSNIFSIDSLPEPINKLRETKRQKHIELGIGGTLGAFNKNIYGKTKIGLNSYNFNSSCNYLAEGVF